MTTAKSGKPAIKRVRAAKPKVRRRQPSHDEIAQRAYFIHLEEGGHDQMRNWLRAEDELTPS